MFIFIKNKILDGVLSVDNNNNGNICTSTCSSSKCIF